MQHTFLHGTGMWVKFETKESHKQTAVLASFAIAMNVIWIIKHHQTIFHTNGKTRQAWDIFHYTLRGCNDARNCAIISVEIKRRLRISDAVPLSNFYHKPFHRLGIIISIRENKIPSKHIWGVRHVWRNTPNLYLNFTDVNMALMDPWITLACYIEVI